jgi:hypothetical protein
LVEDPGTKSVHDVGSRFDPTSRDHSEVPADLCTEDLQNFLCAPLERSAGESTRAKILNMLG